jgi:RNA polymerase sigma-70 factor (ECF subfamily)
MLQLCPPEHRAVLCLRRDGLPLAEIAARTGLHEGSVRRILRRLVRELALEDGTDSSADRSSDRTGATDELAPSAEA